MMAPVCFFVCFFLWDFLWGSLGHSIFAFILFFFFRSSLSFIWDLACLNCVFIFSVVSELGGVIHYRLSCPGFHLFEERKRELRFKIVLEFTGLGRISSVLSHGSFRGVHVRPGRSSYWDRLRLSLMVIESG